MLVCWRLYARPLVGRWVGCSRAGDLKVGSGGGLGQGGGPLSASVTDEPGGKLPGDDARERTGARQRQDDGSEAAP